MPRADNIEGQTFGRLKVVGRIGCDKRGCALWECICECGETTNGITTDLKLGRKTSCGCAKRENALKMQRVSNPVSHGYWGTRIHRIYNSMKSRCYRKDHKAYGAYGGRGIGIYEEWMDNLEAFVNWAIANGYSDDLTIDRIDNDGDYAPTNCRWVSMATQNRNKRVQKRNKTGHTGVKMCGDKYTAQIKIEKKHIHLGTFDTIDGAVDARRKGEIKYWEK